MRSKRGFEVQFNWIFVLVAGSLILIFFATIMFKQKSLSQESANAEILKSFEAIASGASVSLDTTNSIDIPNSEISIKCGSISVGKASKQFQNMIIFSQDHISGNKLITQTLSMNIPYRTTNLLMVSDPDIKYVLIGNDPIIKLINKTLAKEFKKESFELYDPSKIKSNANSKIRIITTLDILSSFPPNINKVQDSLASAVKITGNLDSGSVEFYEKKANSWNKVLSTSYLGKGSLIGAVYSNHDLYLCSMQNAMLKSNIVSLIYKERASQLIPQHAQCQGIYSVAISLIDSITSLSLADVSIIQSKITIMVNLNKELQRKSCPSIY